MRDLTVTGVQTCALPICGLVPLEEVVRGCLDLVYRGRAIEAAYTFRVTRGGDLDLDERHAENLLHVIEEEAKRRPYGLAVRVEVERGMRPDVRGLLLRELQFEDAAHIRDRKSTRLNSSHSQISYA